MVSIFTRIANIFRRSTKTSTPLRAITISKPAPKPPPPSFDVRKFLERGGTKVAKTPAEAREVFGKTEFGKAITRLRSSGGGVTTVPISRTTGGVITSGGVSQAEFISTPSRPQPKPTPRTPQERKGVEPRSKPTIMFKDVPTSFFARQQMKLNEERRRLRTKKLRGKTLTPSEEAKLGGVTILSSLAGLGQAVISLKDFPKFAGKEVKKLVKNPKNIVKLPVALAKKIKEEGVKFGKLLKTSPTEAIAIVGTEYLILKGTGKVFKVTGKLTSQARARISPKFRKIKNNVITVPSKTKGKTVKIQLVAKQVPKIKIKLKKRTLKIGKVTVPTKFKKESLKAQVRRAGTRVTAVSGQADRLLKVIRNQKIIRKPIPEEARLRPKTKALLKRFDSGRISKREIIDLDKRLMLETKGQGSILERSFFADPEGRLRVSRLGQTDKDASLLDILAGDITFKTQRPQILLFENVKIEKLPKSFDKIKNKLKKGKQLTKAEANKLTLFQLKASGKFKPIGKLSTESEISISPGEIIKKDKVIGVTLINGKRIPIVRAKIIKASPKTKKLLKKSRKGNITKKEIRELEKRLEKETGFKNKVSRRTRGVRRRVRVPKRIPRRIIKRRVRVPKRIPRKIPKRPPRRPPKRPPRRPPIKPPIRRPPKRPPRRPPIKPPIRRSPKRPPRRPPIRPPRTPPKRLLLRFKKKPLIKKKKKLKLGYNVFVKAKKRFIKVNKRQLSKRQAQDRGAFFTDHTTSNTYKIVAQKRSKKLGKLTRGEAGSFNRNRKKFRAFKIKKKRKIGLINKFIEKRGKPRIDTRGEKRGLTVAKLLKKKGIRKTKRKK